MATNKTVWLSFTVWYFFNL